MNTQIASQKALAVTYLERAELVARIVDAVLSNRPGTDPAMIERWVLVQSERSVWLFAILNDQMVRKFEPYQEAVHHLSSSLRGMPVLVGNHTGLRLAFLLSEKPQLPKLVQYPGWKKGRMQLGIGSRGQPVELGYGEISHTLVAGITQFGKSNLLRLMAMQARAEGWKLALADPDGRTFSKFEHDAALLVPVGKTLDGSSAVVSQVLELINLRAKLYDQAGNSPDGIEEYNDWAAANGVAEIQPVLVMLDEFNGLVQATGGINGRLAQATTQIAWRAAKFGIRLVLAGQDFEKSIVGPVREQMTTRICLKVANSQISTIVLGKSGAEKLNNIGKAITNRWGLVQIYKVEKDELARTLDSDGMNDEEKKLACFLEQKYDGRMTMNAVQEFGYSERQARRVRADWQSRGLAKIDPARDNALCLSVQAGLDAVQAGLDVQDGGLDAVQTGLDAVRTGLGALAGLDAK